MASHYVPRFLRSQLFGTVPYPTADFSGQTIIVTGSNTGLGRETARHIARLGVKKLILAVRTVSKGEAAADDIANSCSIARSQLEVWELAMNDSDSIKAFVKRTQALDRLDGVVLNSGILNDQSWEFFNGVEAHIAVNVLGTILLAQLLLPVLQRSAEKTGLRGRLAVIGSDIMMLADIRELQTSGSILAKLNNVENQKPSQSRYMISKLLVKYSIGELAQRNPLETTNVIITDLTPGLCKSELLRGHAGFFLNVATFIFKLALAHTTEQGARTLVYGVDPGLPADAHGAFMWDNKVADPGPPVTSDEGVRLAKLWNLELFSELERIAPGCTQV